MDNLKFRVLDKTSGKLEYGGLRFAAQVQNHSRYSKLMQSTGMQDRNKREIYKGDIIRAQYNKGMYEGEVIFGAGSFSMKIRKAEDEERQFDIASTPDLYSFEWIEVIGNIYNAEDA